MSFNGLHLYVDLRDDGHSRLHEAALQALLGVAAPDFYLSLDSKQVWLDDLAQPYVELGLFPNMDKLRGKRAAVQALKERELGTIHQGTIILRNLRASLLRTDASRAEIRERAEKLKNLYADIGKSVSNYNKCRLELERYGGGGGRRTTNSAPTRAQPCGVLAACRPSPLPIVSLPARRVSAKVELNENLQYRVWVETADLAPSPARRVSRTSRRAGWIPASPRACTRIPGAGGGHLRPHLRRLLNERARRAAAPPAHGAAVGVGAWATSRRCWPPSRLESAPLEEGILALGYRWRFIPPSLFRRSCGLTSAQAKDGYREVAAEAWLRGTDLSIKQSISERRVASSGKVKKRPLQPLAAHLAVVNGAGEESIVPPPNWANRRPEYIARLRALAHLPPGAPHPQRHLHRAPAARAAADGSYAYRYLSLDQISAGTASPRRTR